MLLYAVAYAKFRSVQLGSELQRQVSLVPDGTDPEQTPARHCWQGRATVVSPIREARTLEWMDELIEEGPCAL